MFGRKRDPTSDWPAACATPRLDPERHALGELRLGDAFDAARALVRPEHLRSSTERRHILEYAAFELEFHDGRLVCIKFDVADEPVAVGDVLLGRSMTPDHVRFRLGEATEDSDGPDGLHWLDYDHGGATLALEFDADGLTCVQLYAEGYA